MAGGQFMGPGDSGGSRARLGAGVPWPWRRRG